MLPVSLDCPLLIAPSGFSNLCPGKLATLGTQNTGQRLEKTERAIKNLQSKERNWQHWAHMTQDKG
jgi:hypothetical protein